MTRANTSQRRRGLFIGIQWALLLGAIAGVVWYLAPSFNDILAVSQLTWTLALFITMSLLVQFAANGLVLKLLVERFGTRIPMGEAVALGLMDSTLNLLPMKTGTVATGVVLWRRHGIHASDFAAIVGGSTVLNTWICAVVSGVALLGIESQSTLGMWIIVVPTAVVLALLVWGRLHRPSDPDQAATKVGRVFRRAVTGVALIFRSPGLLVSLSLVNVLRLSAVAAQLHAAFAAVAHPINTAEALAIGALAVVLGRLSLIPGGFGFKEAGIAASASILGIPAEFGLAAAVLDRGLMLVALLCFGLPATVYMFRQTRAKADEESASTSEAEAVPRVLPVGNVYDKYGTRNPIAQHLMSRFRRELDAMWALTAPDSQLDIGCGEGVLTHDWAKQRPDGRFVGLDVDDPMLRDEWDARRLPNLEFICGDAESLEYGADEFSLVSAVEVLEHLPNPEIAAQHMSRIAREHLLLSVPREPLWSILNLARGAYWSSLGNTPGHIQHWSRRGFVRFAATLGEVEAVRSPLPWTIVLVRVARDSEMQLERQ